jgi:hypothetical protein
MIFFILHYQIILKDIIKNDIISQTHDNKFYFFNCLIIYTIVKLKWIIIINLYSKI